MESNTVPNNLSRHARAITFITVVFLLALGCALLGGVAINFYACTPLLATLVMLAPAASRRPGVSISALLGLRSSGVEYWAMAALVPAAVLLNSYLLAWVLGIARLDPPGDRDAWLRLGCDNLLGLLPMMMFAFGEEIGWRGYLTSCFAALDARGAVLLVGFVHALWHLPLMLLTTVYHDGGNPVLVVPLFTATLTLGGVFYGYLRLRSGSLWPVVLAHAAFNQAWQALDDVTSSASPLAMEYLAGESGLLTLLAVAVVACSLLRRFTGMPAVVR
ncbi:MAG: CPBP family intramembrane metalloprotease [Gammaproteobacteria bacterium]